MMYIYFVMYSGQVSDAAVYRVWVWPCYSHVSELVCHGEGGAEPVVLDDGAGGLGVTHGAQLCQAERVAPLQLRVTADVLPEGKHSRQPPEVDQGELLNGNAYKTPVRRKLTSSTIWLSRIFDIS